MSDARSALIGGEREQGKAFAVHAPYDMSGDQPQAVAKLAAGVRAGERYQTLLGVTGSGKTFTMAKLIEAVQMPTLVLAPNKTLAAQLANELREFFPQNAVNYFVSYYDYYQPEAYVPQTDTYIEKDSSINEDVEKMRHAATAALLTRKDVIIVASVSCIYGIGSPKSYAELAVFLDVDVPMERDEFIYKLIDMQYDRNDYELTRGTFRVRGDTVDVFAPYMDDVLRVEFFGDEVEAITQVDHLTGEEVMTLRSTPIWPASHYVKSRPDVEAALVSISDELRVRMGELRDAGKLLEAQRLEQRTSYDLEMLETMGFCTGIENYSRHLDGRSAGEAPYTLLDYFGGSGFLTIIDESHVTVPQVRGMYEGDRSRKVTLVEHGFRLASALDNRPLRFDEFEARVPQFVYVSATPGDYELSVSGQVVEQIIRPTGLLDPEIEVRPTKHQIDDILHEAKTTAASGERVLVTTLTKVMAEELTDYLLDQGVRARYLHSDIGTVERVEILRDLRLGAFDVLVGINLLREGLDLPEVSLICILDADQEGFLRNQRSLIQTIGRAARNVSGHVIMYADTVTESMRYALDETARRRGMQQAYNEEHGIEPRTISKAVSSIVDGLSAGKSAAEVTTSQALAAEVAELGQAEVLKMAHALEEQMAEAAEALDFETAARLRDQAVSLRAQAERTDADDALQRLKASARKGSYSGTLKNMAKRRR